MCLLCLSIVGMAAKRSSKRQSTLRERRRRAAKLFERGYTQAEVAHELDVSRVSAMRWHRAWEHGGLEALEPVGPLGRPARLSTEDLERVSGAMLEGPRAHGFDADSWTAPRARKLIERLTSVRYHRGHVWRVLRAMGWTLQRPTTRARERDEDAILTWRRAKYPQLKKTPDGKQR